MLPTVPLKNLHPFAVQLPFPVIGCLVPIPALLSIALYAYANPPKNVFLYVVHVSLILAQFLTAICLKTTFFATDFFFAGSACVLAMRQIIWLTGRRGAGKDMMPSPDTPKRDLVLALIVDALTLRPRDSMEDAKSNGNGATPVNTDTPRYRRRVVSYNDFFNRPRKLWHFIFGVFIRQMILEGTVFILNTNKDLANLIYEPIWYQFPMVFIFGCSVYILLDLMHVLGKFGGMYILQQPEESWPPLFQYPVLARSVVDLWSVRWHQMFKAVWLGCSFRPVTDAVRMHFVKKRVALLKKTDGDDVDDDDDSGVSVRKEDSKMDLSEKEKVATTTPNAKTRITDESMITLTLKEKTLIYFAGLIAVFTASGFFHEYLILCLTNLGSLGDMTRYFLLNGLAAMFESFLPRSVKQRVPTVVKVVVFWTFFLFTSNLFLKPFMTALGPGSGQFKLPFSLPKLVKYVVMGVYNRALGVEEVMEMVANGGSNALNDSVGEIGLKGMLDFLPDIALGDIWNEALATLSW